MKKDLENQYCKWRQSTITHAGTQVVKATMLICPKFLKMSRIPKVGIATYNHVTAVKTIKPERETLVAL